MKRLLIVSAAAALAASGCGKSEQQKQAEEAAKHIEAAAKEISKAAESAGKESAQAANDAAKGFEAMAKGFGAMVNGAAGDGKVGRTGQLPRSAGPLPDRRRLGAVEADRREGLGAVQVLERRGDLHQGRLTHRIEAGRLRLQSAVLRALRDADAERLREGDAGRVREVDQDRRPAGFEKWNTEQKDGELTAMVGKRFLLSIEGRKIDDIKLLHAVVGKVDLAKLAALQ